MARKVVVVMVGEKAEEKVVEVMEAVMVGMKESVEMVAEKEV